MENRRDFLKGSAIGTLALLGTVGAQAAISDKKDNFDDIDRLSDDQIFARVKNTLLVPDNMAYFNTGTLGPSPEFLIDHVCATMRELEANPALGNTGPIGSKMDQTRVNVANFIGADVDEIILTRNTTEGINTVCGGLEWNAGDEILTSNHEHGSAENGLEYLVLTKGAVLKKFEMPMPAKNKQQIIDLVLENITPKTKMLMLSHVITVSGLRMPIREIAEIARDRGIFFIVDGAQAPGMINVNVHELGCDIYAFSGHKWLLGPKETGILYIRKAVQKKVTSTFYLDGYTAYTKSSGTRNFAIIIGFGEIVAWFDKIGKERIEKRCLSLAHYCREQLKDIKGTSLLSATDPELASAIVTISLDSVPNRQVYDKMWDQDIIPKAIEYNALRISNHMFTSNADVDRFVKILKEELA
ncbi:MAG: aminotransferase class V-fold PLP-dependent enzyme [Emcibacteraceae bacterium]